MTQHTIPPATHTPSIPPAPARSRAGVTGLEPGWTVEDSVLVATGWANARACLVGPKGVLVLRLRTGRHGDFEALWVRWMHPVPKPDQQAFDA